MQNRALMGVCVLLAALCRADAAFADQAPAARGDAFAFKLLKQLAKDQPHANLSISPYSAATILQMVENGAAGTTRTEMRKVLGTAGLSSAAVNAANKDTAQSLKSENPHAMLTIANALWYRPGTPVASAFITCNREFYGATVEALDFGDPHAPDIINSWVSAQTQGKIQRIADGMIDPAHTRLFLADAIYFKGKWASPFAASDTRARPFHLRGGGQKMIPMMALKKTLDYRKAQGYQAVRLPYEGENLVMYVVLPDDNSSPENTLRILSGDTWRGVARAGFSSREGSIVLPKFKIEYSVELRRPLQSLGMNAAFDASTADFSGIAPGLFISAARQKTFVEVNEEGTEAAAVSAVGVALTSLKPASKPFQMIVDRPFLLLIEDRQNEAILFMGMVFDPPTT
jgi:serpin B